MRSESRRGLVREAGGRPEPLGATPRPSPGRSQGADAVVHLAQIGAERDGQTYEAVNVGLHRARARSRARAGVPRVVFFSGLGVARYGMSRGA